MVSDLLLPSGGWNSSLIKSYFLWADAEAILKIPLSASRHADSLLKRKKRLWNRDFSKRKRIPGRCTLVFEK
ncbi:hypothetical protein ACOSQ3_031496 [Xanthoceras sorbifolium]